VRDIVNHVLREDVGPGDATTVMLIEPNLRAQGRFVARSDGVIAGWEVVNEVFSCLADQRPHFEILVADGGRCRPGEELATIEGNASTLLTGERTALNILQRMSGIATLTAKYVEAVKGTSAVILDTRKTAPGIRLLDKMAVRIGGGQNHRFGLDDMILIKENHVELCGSISEAVARARSKQGSTLKVEVEVRNLPELEEALLAGPDRILLDNMDIGTMREAVGLAGNRIPLEASGNIALDNVRAVAETGVQFISVGRLTHSVQALDISFILSKEE